MISSPSYFPKTTVSEVEREEGRRKPLSELRRPGPADTTLPSDFEILLCVCFCVCR